MIIRENVDYSTKDYDGFRQDMIDRLQQKIPSYTDTSPSDVGIVLIELMAHGLDILSFYNDKVANELYLDTARERDNAVSIATNILGYEVKENTPSKFYQVFEITPQEDPYVIPKGTIVQTTPEEEETIVFELDEDLVIPSNCTGIEKDEATGEYLYKVSVTQGYTVEDQVIGSSNGLADQEFYIPSENVIRDSVRIFVIGENGLDEEWSRVSNFVSSTKVDKHFRVTMKDNDVAIVKFGNNKSGKIPYAVSDGIIANYRVGGGEIGNVSPHTITEFDDTLLYVKQTFNPTEAYQVGVDKESISDISVNAPADFKTTWGAITLQDYSDLIRPLTFIQDAKSYNEEEDPLTVHVVMLPVDYEKQTEASKKQIKSEVAKMYLKRKALGVKVYLEFAKIKVFNVKVHVNVTNTTSESTVTRTITDLLNANYNINSRSLDQNMYISDIILDVMSVEGVVSSYGTLSVSEEETGQELGCNVDEVLVVGKIDIEVIGGVV